MNGNARRECAACRLPGAGKTTVANLLEERELSIPISSAATRTLDSDQLGRDTYDRMYEHVADSDEHWIVARTSDECRWQERFRGLDDVLVGYLNQQPSELNLDSGIR